MVYWTKEYNIVIYFSNTCHVLSYCFPLWSEICRREIAVQASCVMPLQKLEGNKLSLLSCAFGKLPQITATTAGEHLVV